jgi:nucleoside-diphosphate-sugar epimerase
MNREDVTKMMIGITGGTSGLGKRLTEYLISKGYTVKVLVRKTSQVNDLVKWGAELVYGDINDPASLIAFIKDIDICYHLAAQVTIAPMKQPINVNIAGTENICEAILNYNSNCRLVYCSSLIVTGIRFYNRFLQSSYAISKYKAGKIIDDYVNKHHLKASIIYPGYIYGPYDRNFLPTVLKMLKHGLKFMIKGGERNAAVVYVDDLCELFHLAGTKEIALGKKYVSVKKSDIGIHGFLKMVADKRDYPFPSKVYPKLPLLLMAFVLVKIYKLFCLQSTPKIDMRLIEALSYNSKYFNDNAIRELGWDQKITIPEGIDKALAWQIENQ